MEATNPGEDGALWGQPHSDGCSGTGDAEGKGKEREKSDVPLCPEGPLATKLSLRVWRVQQGKGLCFGGAGWLLLPGCCICAQAAAHSPGGVWLTPDQLSTGSPLCALLCSPAWRLDPCVDPGQVQGHLPVLVQRSERNRQQNAENSALFANVANPSAELDFSIILQVTQQL